MWRQVSLALLLAVGLLVAPLVAGAQPAKVWRIGFLGAGSPTPEIW